MDKKKKHRCKKIRAGEYEYRGWIIMCLGYYHPDQRVVWEAHNPITDCGDYHGFSKYEVKRMMDIDLDD